MLNHQASFSDYVAMLYQPLEAESEDGVVRRRNNETSAKSIQAVQDYATIMSYSRDELMPWLVSYSGIFFLARTCRHLVTL
jgi:hypothetical protein